MEIPPMVSLTPPPLDDDAQDDDDDDFGEFTSANLSYDITGLSETSAQKCRNDDVVPQTYNDAISSASNDIEKSQVDAEEQGSIRYVPGEEVGDCKEQSENLSECSVGIKCGVETRDCPTGIPNPCQQEIQDNTSQDSVVSGATDSGLCSGGSQHSEETSPTPRIEEGSSYCNISHSEGEVMHSDQSDGDMVVTSVQDELGGGVETARSEMNFENGYVADRQFGSELDLGETCDDVSDSVCDPACGEGIDVENIKPYAPYKPIEANSSFTVVRECVSDLSDGEAACHKDAFSEIASSSGHVEVFSGSEETVDPKLSGEFEVDGNGGHDFGLGSTAERSRGFCADEDGSAVCGGNIAVVQKQEADACVDCAEEAENDFADFVSAQDWNVNSEEETFTEFQAAEENSTWPSTTIPSPAGDAVPVVASNEQVYIPLSSQDFQSDCNQSQLVSRFQNLVKSLFPEDASVVPVEPQSVSLFQCLNDVSDIWKRLRNVETSEALSYQWSGSASSKVMLKSLGVDSRNILLGHRWSASVPLFASNLGFCPLEPVKSGSVAPSQPSAPKCEAQCPVTEQNASPPSDGIVPPAQFDWSGSGLVNPLDVLGKELFSTDVAKISTHQEDVLLHEVVNSVCAPAEDRRPPSPDNQQRRKCDSEVQAVLSKLPDLSFMKTHVLMFPMKGCSGRMLEVQPPSVGFPS